MAKLRPASCYRRIKRAYTRKSKYRKKDFIRGVPGSKVVLYDVGAKDKTWQYSLIMRAKEPVCIRSNAIESARICATKYIEQTTGKTGFYLKVRAVPHQVLREHPMATGAGADRFQQGMAHSYGKPYGLTAPVKKGKEILQIFVNKENVGNAKEAMRKANNKIGIKTYLDITELK